MVMADGQTTTFKSRNTAIFKASYLNSEALYTRYLFGTYFKIGGGLGIAFPLSSFIEKQKEILEPDNFKLETHDIRYKTEQNGKVLVFEENDVTNINSYGKIGISYEMYRIFGINALLTPSFFYNFPFNKATKTESFKITTFEFGLDFKIAL